MKKKSEVTEINEGQYPGFLNRHRETIFYFLIYKLKSFFIMNKKFLVQSCLEHC